MVKLLKANPDYEFVYVGPDAITGGVLVGLVECYHPTILGSLLGTSAKRTPQVYVRSMLAQKWYEVKTGKRPPTELVPVLDGWAKSYEERHK